MRILLAAALTAACLITLALPAAAPAAKNDVKVMSRNLYLGADLIPLVGTKDRDDVARTASGIFSIVRQTNFPLRSRAIAAEIRRTKPDLIGLQEVALFRRSADGQQDDQVNATRILYDFLGILQKELRKRGMSYRAVVVKNEADAEVPLAEGYDGRLTMRDVILMRTGRRAKVKFVRGVSGTFSNLLTVQIPTGPIVFTRGWTAIDAKVAGKSFRFVNTHLEAYGGQIREAQAKQLLSTATSVRKRRTILVGDMNSDPRDPAADAAAYNAIFRAGFRSAWPRPVPTSGQNERVNNPRSELKRWIDHIFSRPRMRVIDREVVGERSRDRIGGLWPSDHAGVVATYRVR
jgi:endonuclease/exonuclease/phosphatase family metal-dependent hydrolase